MIDIEDVVLTLVPASFAGVPFWMPDSRLTVGRRVQSFLFPGRDDRVFEDLGAFDGPIEISGVLIGDDYVGQAQTMRATLRTAGPAILMHPWLGELLVILTSPGEISFDQKRLRVALLKFTVELYAPDAPPATDTLGAVDDGLDDLQTQAAGLLSAVLSTASLTLATVAAVQSVCGQVVGIFDTVAAGVVSIITSAAAVPLAALAAVDGLALDVTYAGAVAALLLGPGEAIVATSATLEPAAIGPGDVAPATTPQDPRVTTALLVAATGQIAALPVTGAAGAVVLAAAASVLSSAIDASSDIAYTSQQDAQAWQTQLLGVINQVALLAVSLAPALPSTAGAVWRSTQRLQGAVSADFNAQIGRLPAVQTLTLGSTMPTWLVAQALVGDTPAQVAAMYLDLVARNDVENPAMIGPGTIEALVA